MEKPVAWLTGSMQTPPWSIEGRRQVGFLLRLLQRGHNLGMPHSRPMPSVGRRVHELRVPDPKARATWRVLYRIDPDAIVVAEWFDKNDNKTPRPVIDRVRTRLAAYDQAARS